MTNNVSIVNVGIIGPGRVAERHASAINQISNGRLWSIAGRNVKDTQCFASKHNAQAEKNAFIDISEMLSDPLLDLELYTDNMTVIGHDLAGDKRSILIDNSPLIFKKNNPYIDQLNDFLRVIQENAKPEVGIIEGLKNIEHMLSIWQ